MMVTFINGEFASSFYPYEMNIVTDTYVNQDSFALIAQEDALLLVTDSLSQVVYGIYHAIQPIGIEDVLDNTVYQMQQIELSQFSIQYESLLLKESVNESDTLDVPFVENDTSPDTGKGLCWAASTASLVAHKQYMTYSAMDIYDLLKRLYNPDVYGYPEGSDFFVTSVWDHYNLIYTHDHSGTNVSVNCAGT